jgi:hypothetical protein
MDLESLLPLLFAAIYIISRFLKSKPKPGVPNRPMPQQQGQQPDTPPTRKKAFSFEDILKEFEKNLAGEQIEDEKPLPVEQMHFDRPKPAPVVVEEKRSPYHSFEGMSYEDEQSPVIVEEEKDFERNEKYQMKETEVSDFVEMLRDPNGAKNAIVLSEIINRKYF